MEFRVLGPLEVRSDRQLLALGGPKPRAVLTDLLVHLGSVVSRDRLIDDLWGFEPPASAEAIVQNAISRLRKSLGPTAIETVAPGYLLAVDPGSVDAHRFERLVRQARPLPAGERVVALRDALALWRGPAFMELSFEPFLQGEIARLDELRLTALEDTLEAEIELQLHDRVAAELEALATQEPTRERLRRLQMLALHRSGRTQDALDAYEQMRRAIDDQSGLEPSAETKALHLMILRDDAAIAPTSVVAPRQGVSRRSVALLVAGVEIDSDIDLEAAASLVAAAHDALKAAVIRHGGTVGPALGYESVAVFGADAAHEDDVVRAGRAAIEACEIVRGRGVPVRYAIGLGKLLVEDGMPVLLGGALEDVRAAVADTPRGEVVVTSSAARMASGAFVLRSKRGREHLVAVRPGRVSRAATTARLIGRDPELAYLRDAFLSAVSTGVPVHVVVAGEAGLGKTRLVREFVAGVDAFVLQAACVSYGEGMTFLPLGELAEQAALLDDTAPAIGDIANAAAAFASARALLDHFLASGPVLLALDDLQWAMPTFLDLVEYVVTACQGPLLVVSGGRPELLVERPSWRASVLALEPLSAGDTCRLIEAYTGADDLKPDVVDAIVETAAGYPLFVEQLVANAREAGSEGSSVPPSLDAVLTSRLDRLAHGERVVLQHAAVLGVRFDRAVLAELADGDESGLDARLQALVRAGLVRVADGGWIDFDHALVRDAAYEGIPKAARSSLHERAARTIGLAGRYDVSAVAFHLEAAAQLSRDVGVRRPALELEAGQRLGEAGLEQWRGGDASGGSNLLGRASVMLARDEPLRLEVLVELGLALRACGEHARASAVLEEARDAAHRSRRRRIELRVDVESIIPGMSSAAWDDAEAVSILDRALPVFRRARDDRGLGQALLVRAFLSSIGCCFADSAVAAEEALAALVRAGYSPSRALLVLAAAALHGPSSVVDARGQCVALRLRAAGDVLAQANVDLIRAMIEAVGGETSRARQLLAEATEVFENHGQRSMMLTDCVCVAADIDILAGDTERTAAALEAAAAELRDGGQIARAARLDAFRAEVAYMSSDPARAVKLARQALRSTPPADLHAKVTCMRIAGKALAATRRDQAGRRLVGDALDALDGSDALELRSRVLVDLAEAEWSGGSHTDLIATLAEASAAASAKGSVLLERRIAGLRDRLGGKETPGSITPGPR